MSAKEEYDKVKYSDWMQDSDENDNQPNAFDQSRFDDGLEGHMRLQLEKTFGGDDRFKLTNDFNVSLGDANKHKKHVPDIMLGALSKREQEDFFAHKSDKKSSRVQINTGGYSSLDEDGEDVGTIAWKHNLNLEKERSQALNILSTIVPASEVFLTSSKS